MAKVRQGRAISAGGGARGSSWTALWVALGFVALLWTALPSVVVFVVGMLPALAAFIIDRSSQRYLSFCVGAMNFCGVFPQLMSLWETANNMNDAVFLLSDVYSLLIMYGTAALGWLLFLGVPPVVGTFMSVLSQRRIAVRRALQKDLIGEWGDEVAGVSRQAKPRGDDEED